MGLSNPKNNNGEEDSIWVGSFYNFNVCLNPLELSLWAYFFTFPPSRQKQKWLSVGRIFSCFRGTDNFIGLRGPFKKCSLAFKCVKANENKKPVSFFEHCCLVGFYTSYLRFELWNSESNFYAHFQLCKMRLLEWFQTLWFVLWMSIVFLFL